MKELIVGNTTYYVNVKTGDLYYDKQKKTEVSKHMFLKSQYEEYLTKLAKLRGNV